MAESIAAGVREAPDCKVIIKRVPETIEEVETREFDKTVVRLFAHSLAFEENTDCTIWEGRS
jgi:hypothetical protein